MRDICVSCYEGGESMDLLTEIIFGAIELVVDIFRLVMKGIDKVLIWFFMQRKKK